MLCRTRCLPAALPVVLLAILAGFCSGEEPTYEQVVERMQPYGGQSVEGVDTTTLAGKVMCGYQGWFAASGDGSGRGWLHYGRGGQFEPGKCSIDLWPDVSELD